MYIIDNRLGYIAHPNTGSRSMRIGLEAKTNVEKIGHHHGFNPDIIANLEGCYCVVRNPYEMMVSWWCRGGTLLPFNEWLPEILKRHRHFEGTNHSEGGGLFYGIKYCTDVLKFENLQYEFDKLMLKYGMKMFALPVDPTSVTQGKPDQWWKVYDLASKRLVEGCYSSQIQYGGYTCP